LKYKAKTFRKKLLGYFLLFTVVIFSVLWLLQTVFLQKNRLQKPKDSEYYNSKKHKVTEQFFSE
jgi:hypothetical protein